MKRIAISDEKRKVILYDQIPPAFNNLLTRLHIVKAHQYVLMQY